MNARSTQGSRWEFLQDDRFEAYRQSNRLLSLTRDSLAGFIVALIAIPLGVGFAIASGLKPEQGIVAGAVAGILGGVFGGSKYQVYGPTAAFIPLLSSITARYGASFLALASILAGFVIMAMGLLKWGRYFSKVPFSITVGFTVGIAFSIALGQMPDVLGSLQATPPHTLEKVQTFLRLLAHPNLSAVLIAIMTFVIIRASYKISVFVPGPLIAILLAVLLEQTWLSHESIPLIGDKLGPMGGGIFKITLPALDASSAGALLVPVLSIVFIASLESLLSARMADRLADNKTPFNPDQELVGQGIVNTLVPLFNGFPCTGAFARTATSIKAGAASPVASVVQGLSILLLMLIFAKYIALLPMACIGGLLIYVACSMVKLGEIREVLHRGRFHTFLMLYTAVVTLAADLFVAVFTGTAIYYLKEWLLAGRVAKTALVKDKVSG